MPRISKFVRVVTKKALEPKLLSERVRGEVIRELRTGAKQVERSAKRRAPVAFNFLRSSIHTRGPIIHQWRVIFEVVAGRAYAAFVEFGTGPLGKASKLLKVARDAMREMGYVHGSRGGWPPTKFILRWMRRKGIPESLRFVIQRKIRKEGTPAQPYLFPAFEEFRKSIVDGVARAARRALGL